MNTYLLNIEKISGKHEINLMTANQKKLNCVVEIIENDGLGNQMVYYKVIHLGDTVGVHFNINDAIKNFNLI
jgi:hypothetical protein